jgi:hypothetical protein
MHNIHELLPIPREIICPQLLLFPVYMNCVRTNQSYQKPTSVSFPVAMPVKSLYPDIDIPNIDLFTFLFERKNRPYADEKS